PLARPSAPSWDRRLIPTTTGGAPGSANLTATAAEPAFSVQTAGAPSDDGQPLPGRRASRSVSPPTRRAAARAPPAWAAGNPPMPTISAFTPVALTALRYDGVTVAFPPGS